MLGHLFRKYFALLYSLIGETFKYASNLLTFIFSHFFFSNDLYKHVIYLIKYICF